MAQNFNISPDMSVYDTRKLNQDSQDDLHHESNFRGSQKDLHLQGRKEASPPRADSLTQNAAAGSGDRDKDNINQSVESGDQTHTEFRDSVADEAQIGQKDYLRHLLEMSNTMGYQGS